METFAERIKTLRIEHGWSQGQLAARASMYTTMVNRYEAGRCIPRGKALDHLAAALGITRAELIAGCAMDKP